MAAVASFPQSHFNRTLSQSQHVDERPDLGEGPSSNASIRPLHPGLTPSQSLASVSMGFLAETSDVRAQLLNPASKHKSQASASNRGQLWKEALKNPVQFTPGQKFNLGSDIPLKPINRPIHPGQGKGVLMGAMGPLLPWEADGDTRSDKVVTAHTCMPDSSGHTTGNENRPPKLIGPVRPAADSPPEVDSVSDPSACSSATPPIATSWPRLQRIGPGFRNTGNTCFLNATLQALVYTPALAVGLLDRDEHRRDSCRLSQMKKFCALCNMHDLLSTCLKPSSRDQCLKPFLISSNLPRIAPLMRGHRQEDAHEFLRMLIEAMQNAALGGREKTARQADKEATFIYRMFAGKFRSRVTCQHCKATSDTFDTFLDLSLDIGQVNSVANALRQLKQLDHLKGSNQYRCEKQLRDAKKELSVCEVPPILTLHIKRFNASARKVNKRIHFSESLDLRSAMGPDSPPTRYKLYAVVCHQGANITRGHYYSYIKASNGQWYECDDERVRMVSSNVVYGSHEAYMFFYARDPEDMLEAAIQNNRTTADIALGNSREPTWRKRKSSHSVASSSRSSMNESESWAREESCEPGKKAKFDPRETSSLSSERSRIIGPMLPSTLSAQPINTSFSPTLGPIYKTLYDNRDDEVRLAPGERVEDLGESVARSSLGGHQLGNSSNGRERKKPKHRALVNGNGPNRQISHHRFNSVNDMRPKTIRG